MGNRSIRPLTLAAIAMGALGLAGLGGCKMGGGNSGPRVSVAASQAQTVSSYFSIYAHGPTRVMVPVEGQKAALLLDFPNESKTISGTGRLHVFAETASEDMIEAWWNNQYSDALFPDAAEPVETISLGGKLEIVSAEMTGTERPREDQSYDVMAVTYRIADVPADRFTLEGFEGETTVYVMMEGKRP
ncbi:hypothetical protein [Aquisalinus flavus]|uniref:Uncharacterized protein n=1 Tax=Aquisalinus flavus TaxID=1526572 RepID=A0A8J2V4B4_9PROT|nr:hypothetical protein [Aquisalinus flavus]MBD0427119.1 hypothetical protein [Aquisalinus flavus]UNE46940.1 hypothetical protein FF099_02150 [Aquisalinus flavus]GGC98537.1 hypothetical protein GCM10011342_04330 [Aquisalinus flavus]